ncbi:MAG: HD domain-containing protein [Clostridiales bacterium]|nr:HD domain-containing protein [Clostridiales bacterium]
MPKRDRPALAAAIDIGSTELRMKIAQINKNKIRYPESLTYPLALGRDTFTTGKISFEKVDKACDIIKNFLLVTDEYGVARANVRAAATTAVRESSNIDYFLDQVKIKTGMVVSVIDDMEEKLYIYKMLTHMLKDSVKESAVMVYIGSGNIGAALLQNGRAPFTRNIKIGSLRISEMFGDIQEHLEFYLVLEEYLRTFTSLLPLFDGEINHFVAAGTEIAMLADITNTHSEDIFYHIPKEKFLSFYEDVKTKTTDQAALDYNLSNDKAELLLPTMSIFHDILALTKAGEIIASDIMLSDALLYETLCPIEFEMINKDFAKNAVLSAKMIADKCGTYSAHCALVSDFSQKIFDKLKKLHNMNSREKMLLQIGAVLHDIGKFINITQHYEHSYKIILGSDIVGLNQTETEIVANIALYHEGRVPAPTDVNYQKLSLVNRVMVSKLTAILSLANALDASHTQKFKSIDVKLSKSELLVTVATDKNIDLEQWAFKDKSHFFEEVFGIKAIVRKKRVM